MKKIIAFAGSNNRDSINKKLAVFAVTKITSVASEDFRFKRL